MGVKVENPRDIDSAYDDLFDLEQRASAPNTDADYAAQDQRDAAVRDSQSQDLGEVARGGEQTSGSWANNTSSGGAAAAAGGLQGLLQKGKVILKNRGAIFGLIALLGGGAAVPFLSAASLPFAIVGNMDAKSMLLGLNQYLEDYMGFKIYGSDKASVKNGKAGELAGLSKAEVEQLKKNGVELDGATKTKFGKTTYSRIRVKGGAWVKAGPEFMNAMRTNVEFRKSMLYTKGSYWKSAKSTIGTKVRSLFGVNTNPDISGKNKKERDQKLFEEATGDSSGSAKPNTTDGTDGEDGKPRSDSEKAKANGTEVAGEVGDEIEATRERLADGDFTDVDGRRSNQGDIVEGLTREAPDVIDGTKGLAGKIWGFANSLDTLDTICTIYDTAVKVNVIARGYAMINIVRFAMTIRTTIEKAKAGDDDGESVKYLMDMIQQVDPATGKSFDATSYASMLFSGTLSAEPSAVSALGGQSIVALNMGMYALHSAIGAAVSTAGLRGGAGGGREFLRKSCNIVTNLGAQISVTIGAWVVGFFTGGGTIAAQEAVKVSFKAGMKIALDKVKESLVKKFGKEAREKIAADIRKDGIKYFSSRAWGTLKVMWNGMGPWDKVGFLVAGVSTFGMAYIIDALSGGNIAGFIKNGFAAFDALGTGWNQYDYSIGMGQGGTIANFVNAEQYEPIQGAYEAQYIADQKYDAKDTPLDISTPYSTLGAALLNVQKTVGISASTNMLSTLKSIATLPFKLPGLSTAHADDKPTPAEINAKIGDPYLEEKQVSVTETGTPKLTFKKTMSFDTFLEKFVYPNSDKVVDGELESTGMVTYDGDDEATGQPKLSIKPGSKLEQYRDLCHNPDRQVIDPQFAKDDGSDYLDLDKCMAGGSEYKPEYAEYDDAIRFINQVNPEDSQTSEGDETTTVAGDGAKIGDYTKGQRYQCAAWIGQRVLPDIYGIPNPGGNGNEIAPNLGNKGYKVDHTPAVHSIVSFPAYCKGCGHGSSYAGHVAVVYAVNADGSIEIEDYNGSGNETYTTSHVAASVVPRLSYAHVEGEFGKGPKAKEILGDKATN